MPLNRAGEKRGVGAKRGFSNQNSTSKKARGGVLDIVHPVENIIQNAIKITNTANNTNGAGAKLSS